MVKDEISLAEIRRREKLKAILERENAKDTLQNKVRCSRDPAKFRHTILTASHAGGLEPKTDAEKSSTRRSLVAARQSKQVAGTRPVKARSASSAPEKQKAAPRVGDDLLLEAEDAETSYAAKLALAARENRARSGWAAMVKYADNLAAEEDVRRRVARQREQERQREILNRQMDELKMREDAERRELEREAELVARQVEQYKAQEDEKRRQELEHGRRLRDERNHMLEEVNRQRALEAARRKKEEDDAIRAALEAVEEEKRRKHDDMLRRRAEMERFRQENEENLQKKRDEQRRIQEEDAEKMREYIKFLEQQEKEREAKLKDFFESISKRATAAGAMAVKENEERAAREEEMLRQQWAEAEERAKLKEEEERRRQAMINDELARVRAQQIKIKTQQKERMTQEMKRFMETVRQHDQEAVQAELDKERMRRERNLRYRKMLEDQIREREEREILEPAVMTVQEAKLNEPILVSATRILGPDHIKKDTLTSRPDVRYTTLGRFAP